MVIFITDPFFFLIIWSTVDKSCSFLEAEMKLLY